MNNLLSNETKSNDKTTLIKVTTEEEERRLNNEKTLETRLKTVRRLADQYVHTLLCEQRCISSTCIKMKLALKHQSDCRKSRRETGTKDICSICNSLTILRRHHGMYCDDQECPLGFCSPLKNQLATYEEQNRGKPARRYTEEDFKIMVYLEEFVFEVFRKKIIEGLMKEAKPLTDGVMDANESKEPEQD